MIFTIDNTCSINDQINKMNSGDTLILKCGIYNEKVEVFKDNIIIIGEDKDNTIITNNDYYHKIMPDYNECNTFRSYSMYIGGNNVNLSNLTIRNSSTPSSIYGQAVALHVDSNYFTCKNVIIDSAQDSLFTGPLPPDLIERHKNFLRKPFLKSNPSVQIYDKCTIKGDVDFIFGTATALFLDCDIISIKRGVNTFGNNSFISAPAHSKDCKFGYLFHKCNILAEDENQKAYLARPWRDYGTAAFIDCKMGNHILEVGYNKWNNTNRDKTARFYEYTENVDLTKRESWAHILTKEEKNKYLNDFYNYINTKKIV